MVRPRYKTKMAAGIDGDVEEMTRALCVVPLASRTVQWPERPLQGAPRNYRYRIQWSTTCVRNGAGNPPHDSTPDWNKSINLIK